MSQILEQAEQLRKQAIAILIAERAAIDEQLKLLAYDRADAPAGPPPVKKARACAQCGQPGHSAKTCKGPDSSCGDPSSGATEEGHSA